MGAWEGEGRSEGGSPLRTRGGRGGGGVKLKPGAGVGVAGAHSLVQVTANHRDSRVLVVLDWLTV